LHRVSDTERQTPEEPAFLEFCRELRSLSRAGPAPTIASRTAAATRSPPPTGPRPPACRRWFRPGPRSAYT